MANELSENNKRIAKNTIALYIRMLIATVVSLYTSRIVLSTLGASDYGVYSIVGGVVAMFGFLNASMSGATSRFLTYELGRGDKEKLAATFSSAFWVHAIIALVIVLLSETVGLWFLNTKLVIPEESRVAAQWVYQFSILSTVIGITQVPYNASIISHEKMDIYAYVEILNVVLKLVIVYLLLIGNFNKLILYAFLVLCVSTLIAFIYRIYCVRHFEECHVKFKFDKSIMLPMLSFSGWDLYGNGCVTARQQGTNFLINMFFGVTLNAASGVATTVSGVISGFASNITTAFRPQIIKSYAVGNIAQMESQMSLAFKSLLVLYSCMAVPLYLNAGFVFDLWLGTPPQYAVEFCRLLLICLALGLVNSIAVIAIHATGDIKLLSFIGGSIYLFSLPVTYLAFKMNLSCTSSYTVMIASNIVVLLCNLMLLKRNVKDYHPLSHVKCIVDCFICIIASTLLVFVLFKGIASNRVLYLILSILSYAVTISIMLFVFLLNKDERKQITSIVCKWKNKS